MYKRGRDRRRSGGGSISVLEGTTGELTGKRLKADSVLQMVKRRTGEAGFDPDQVTCHTFWATSITTYPEDGCVNSFV